MDYNGSMEYAKKEGLRQGREEGMKQGIEEGREEGIEQGIHTLIESLRSFSIPDEAVIGQLVERYELTKDEASVFIRQK